MSGASAWLQVVQKDQQVYLSSSRRLNTLNERLSRPRHQYPSVLFCIGRAFKFAALRSLFPSNRLSERTRATAVANVFVDEEGTTADYPIFFAESNPIRTLKADKLPVFEQSQTFKTAWRNLPNESIRHELYVQLFFPLSDVICIFIDDFADYDKLLLSVSKWILHGNCSSLPSLARPTLLLVSYVRFKPGVVPSTYAYFVRDLQPRLEVSSEDLRAVFQGVYEVQVASPADLRKVTMFFLSKARQRRRKARCHFSATHLAAFFERRLPQMSNVRHRVFNFLRTARQDDEIDAGFVDHLKTFVEAGLKQRTPRQKLALVIATAILMNAFPPAMHIFDPMQVFGEFYKAKCYDAFYQLSGDRGVAKWFVQLVMTYVNIHAGDVLRGVPAARVHESTLASEGGHLGRIKLNKCCSVCIFAKPEHFMACEHGLCDCCVRIFARQISGSFDTFEVIGCTFCDIKEKLLIYLKPPTAGIRMLTVDGGGVRGIVPLETSRLLEEEIGAGCRIQNHIDVAFGTSAGGLVVLGLFYRQWDVRDAIKQFISLTHEIFRSRPARSIVRKAHRYFKSVIADCLYDAKGLEAALKLSFGACDRLFGHPVSGISRTKIAVIASTISDARAFVFSNYNGRGSRDSSIGYRHFRAPEADGEPYVWEAARATSAAPLYFKPVQIRKLGTLQDGCMALQNNPIEIALSESREIWTADTPVDLILSLGTGLSKPTTQSPKATRFRHFNNSFLSRVVTSFFSSLDGQSRWNTVANHMRRNKTSTSTFRFNTPLVHKEPEIDDVKCMDTLREDVVHSEASKRTRATHCLIAASFYLELQRAPVLDDGFFRCDAFLLCRDSSYATFDMLDREYRGSVELTIRSLTVPFDPFREVCGDCETFSKPVTFYVRHPTESITVSLRMGGEEYKISGFPATMEWFIKQQKLDRPFGGLPSPLQPVDDCKQCCVHPVNGLTARKRKAQCREEARGQKRKCMRLG